MTTKLITGALIAAMLLPAAATAQTSQRELQRDRQDIRAEQRDVRHAVRHGNARDVREERRDVREARREYREDWQDYRTHHRDAYRAPRFAAPFRYRPFATGAVIQSTYLHPRYRVADVGRWHLPPAARYQTYVRHYDDLLLVNVRNGTVLRVYRNFYW